MAIDTGAVVVSVDYRLRKINGEWRVIDVVVEGVSLVSSYRSQFQEIMASGGPDVAPLYLLLFPALVIGYLTLAATTWSALRRGSGDGLRVFVPAAIALALLVPLVLPAATALPAAMATMFLSAPPISTPVTSSLV